jgi:excisionase family DNA binding protein
MPRLPLPDAGSLLGTAEVARLCGVAETTIKRWADEGLLACVRTAGGHRRFPVRELRQFLTSHEYAVPPELAARAGPADPDPEGITLYALNREFDRIADRFLERTLRPVPGALEAMLRTLGSHGVDLATTYDRIVCPTLRRIAIGWEEASLSLVQIHVAVAEIEEAMARVRARHRAAAPIGRQALVACLSPDHHTLPVRMAANLLEAEGWSVLAARGASPAQPLADYLRVEQPDLLCLSVTVVPDPEAFLHEANLVADAAREIGAIVVLGGRAVRELRSPLPADRILADLPGLVTASREL